jgi:hypothetical protein
MTNLQESKLKSYNSILSILKDYQETIRPVPAVLRTQTRLQELVARIDGAHTEYGLAIAGKTKLKHDAREALIMALLPVAGSLSAYAHENAKADVKSRAGFSENRFRSMRELELIDNACSVHSAASEHASAIEEFGITKEHLAALRAAIDAYRAMIDGRQVGSVARQDAHSTVAQLFSKVDELLSEVLDRQMELFRAVRPEFYERYFLARNYRVLGVRHEPQPPEQPAAQG